jgi:hypothetical protein
VRCVEVGGRDFVEKSYLFRFCIFTIKCFFLKASLLFDLLSYFCLKKADTKAILVGRPESKRPLEKPRRRWEDNIKMDLREIGIDGANWAQLAQDRVQWRACVNTIINLWVP